MITPAATYRLQFHQGFRFIDGRDLVPYLSELGITDMYSSPRYSARRGSAHGYDIADPLRVNSELGTEQDFSEMSARLRHYGMGLVLDTVPNHMAASYENPWWTDVLENGQSSAYAGYFDIDWHPATKKASFLQENRVVLPILGDLYGNVLSSGQLSLRYEDTGMLVRYYQTRLPLDPKSYTAVLARCEGCAELDGIVSDLERLPSRDDRSSEAVMLRRREKERIKQGLWRAVQANAELKREIENALAAVAASPDELDALLSSQAYRLAYWKIGFEEINYRRFFDINDLVALRVESPEVFDNRHRRTMEMVRGGEVTGLRIDHIDGLWDPECYLRRLAAHTDGVFTVVEKILGRDEKLPAGWPVAGTTGYEFLNTLTGIFVKPEGLASIEADYSRRTGMYLPFAEQCYQANKQVMQTLFAGDVTALTNHLAAISARHRHARDVRVSELQELLVEVSACLPVYRTYINGPEVSEADRRCIGRTLELARRRTSPQQISDQAFDFLRSVLLLEPPPYLTGEKDEWRRFVMRWQQFTGPVMAKGLEDTTAYRHNSLLSLNEVGGDPLRERPPATLEEFHEFNRRRAEDWPGSLNATATHDTKRGEDLRARLNVLTEIPVEWEERLSRWTAWNEAKRVSTGGTYAPGAAEEILIYQTLLGGWPSRGEEQADFPARVSEFLVKALREAKQNSSWMSPNEEYESGVRQFLDSILAAPSEFVTDLHEFRARISLAAARNGLSQLLLKIAAPGVPDFYQGTEFWSFSLVDPDNRRTVDYERRTAMLETLRRRWAEDRIALVRELAADLLQDEMKLFVTWRGLEFRRTFRELFARGAYVALPVRGKHAEHVCAFARHLEGRWAVAVAPRWTLGVHDWADTAVVPPAAAEWQDALTGLIPASLRVGDLLSEFPVALLGESGAAPI
jgi:(1->4)-alpha-D-glucan 1-alpha-D-glucosylmutase